eukprot:gnl/MRDRNA2_/MRDRNA2_62603_c0_seq2.p1 gnl/MRDRNA2_/MRDRNA2_62603_c0~~gnl/MRDRNA2_/MRDRNA2_62603_c0_seq2.p1  ORF type:complete len:258 (+),score=20.43 gnl/MRDRNA2_/MRDRNA2_62603_c0_seq2:58-774(+)
MSVASVDDYAPAGSESMASDGSVSRERVVQVRSYVSEGTNASDSVTCRPHPLGAQPRNSARQESGSRISRLGGGENLMVSSAVIQEEAMADRSFEDSALNRTCFAKVESDGSASLDLVNEDAWGTNRKEFGQQFTFGTGTPGPEVVVNEGDTSLHLPMQQTGSRSDTLDVPRGRSGPWSLSPGNQSPSTLASWASIMMTWLLFLNSWTKMAMVWSATKNLLLSCTKSKPKTSRPVSPL